MADREPAERTLPHNLEAERSVLGAVIVNNPGFDQVASLLRGASFYRDAHRRIWNAIVRLRDGGVVVDFVTLKEELLRVGDLDDVGGPSYVASLADGVPKATNVVYYGRIVAEKAMLRDSIYAANKMLVDCYEAEDSPDEILRRADLALLDIQNRRGGGRMASLRSGQAAHMQELEFRVQHKGELRGIDTGFAQLNIQTMGWRRGDLIIPAGRPSMGKTTFVLNTAVAGARAGAKTLIFSFEMGSQELQDKLLADISGVALTRIENGYLGSEDYKKISEAMAVIHDLPIWIDDKAGQTIHDIRTTCRRMQAEEGLDQVFVDYIQLIPGSLDRRGATRNDELTDISRRSKILAKELNIPVHMLSQLKRKDGRYGSIRPKLEDLRECGALEQDADIVAFIHRKSHRESGLTEFILEKQRKGSTGTVMLNFDRDISRFSDAPEDTPTPEPESEDQPRSRRKKA